MIQEAGRSGEAKKWFHPGSNRGPSLRESDVITNYTMKPSGKSGSRVWSRGKKGKDSAWKCLSLEKKSCEEKSGSTQNRTGVLRTRISYAAPTPWNRSGVLARKGSHEWSVKLGKKSELCCECESCCEREKVERRGRKKEGPDRN